MDDNNGPPSQLTRHDYTVGWVCALPKEQVAAIAMLDRRHPKIEKPSDDPNSYNLGSIGSHNVVITCLPKGQVGTIEAGITASRMLITFPSIKIGLMAGIAGGVPSNGVRLGDVVIGTPSGEYPGVVQWDLGKIESGGILKRTGALNKSPKALLTAVSTLETEHQLGGSTIPQRLEELRTKWPRLVDKYCWSQKLTDPLATEGSRNIYREPEVHYGIIASGDRVIKDAETRDCLNESLGGKVLAIEMEAAGLMDNFPCIVIRGICDYADSHKNDEWQEYAAAVAAACSKELLEVLDPGAVAAESPLTALVGRVHKSVMEVKTDVASMRSILHEKEDQKLLEWIAPIDYNPQYYDLIRRRQQGTSQWILQRREYHTFLESDKQILLCHGIPGAGKSIIAATVIDDLQRRFRADLSVGIAFILGNFKRKEDQKVEDLLAGIVRQLAQCGGRPMEHVRALQELHRARKTRPSVTEISETLKVILMDFSKVVLVVDAFDELYSPDGTRDAFLQELHSLQTHSNLNILITSRPLPDIMCQFENGTMLEILATSSDIETYLEGQMDRLPKFIRKKPELKKQVREAILGSFQGMFLLAQLYVESLVGKVSVNALRAAVENLPHGPEEEVYGIAYEEQMSRVVNQSKDRWELAEKILVWIICAKRPLDVLELQHLLGVVLGETTLDKDNLPEIDDMVSVCAGLVTIERPSNIIRLAHYTTHEYLDRTRNRWFETERVDIARTCLTYLYNDAPQKLLNSFTKVYIFQEHTSIPPGYEYASNFWECHIQEECIPTEEVVAFLENQLAVQASWNFRTRLVLEYIDLEFTGLHLAAWLGLDEAAQILLTEVYPIDVYTASGRTPLSYAAEGGHASMIDMLLKNGAHTDLAYNENFPLVIAAQKGHDTVIKLLLQHGADVNSKAGGHTAVFWAARSGHQEVVKTLLKGGAKANYYHYTGNTLLMTQGQLKSRWAYQCT
ncbi:hypothetical protein TrVGV298_006687 [Trichoderma virens]|nr:hypothetical protein TrVGV298_006687 [Trichoderma virens]